MNLDRVEVRRSATIASGINATNPANLTKGWFEALATTPEQAELDWEMHRINLEIQSRRNRAS